MNVESPVVVSVSVSSSVLNLAPISRSRSPTVAGNVSSHGSKFDGGNSPSHVGHGKASSVLASTALLPPLPPPHVPIGFGRRHRFDRSHVNPDGQLESAALHWIWQSTYRGE
jgi:hypothetical protein